MVLIDDEREPPWCDDCGRINCICDQAMPDNFDEEDFD